jgi:photosystem II stability/assembly factor-like uncharacterized protein
MAAQTLLLVGTKKGAFILRSDAARTDWTMSEPMCEGWPIHDVTFDPSDGAIYAAGGGPWYGGAVWRTDDRGQTWTHSSAGLTYGDDGEQIKTLWSVTPGHGRVYAGVEPAGLFASDDRGATWSHVSGLRDHPSRPGWQPGAGGLILHTIVPHPSDAARTWVAISAVGTFATEDGGRTWEARNRGVRAGFMPDPHPETGQCVHKLRMAAGTSERLYQQNHCGVYVSDDAGRSWKEITEGLPSEFGFAMGTHPRDRDTAWVIPLTPPEAGRFVVDASAAVWRTEDAGASWERMSQGLPQENAYLSVLREAMGVDSHDPAGVYFGTSSGELYASIDEGRSWRLIAEHLPEIWAVDAVVVD